MLQEFVAWIANIWLWNIEAQADNVPDIIQKAPQLPQWVLEVTWTLVCHKPNIHPAANDML
jgi:hypothetical protein